MLNFKMSEGAFLLCAGKIADDKELQQGVLELEKRGLARVINRYVTDKEEELCFAACDAVLLPYVKHFGSSGVLSRAAAANKFVIASDEGLVAKRVKEKNLGLLFRSEKVESLRESMLKAIGLNKPQKISFENSARLYAKSCSRPVFRSALTSNFIS
jgi:glycosyltransferase involved in cell wall biosynthesis